MTHLSILFAVVVLAAKAPTTESSCADRIETCTRWAKLGDLSTSMTSGSYSDMKCAENLVSGRSGCSEEDKMELKVWMDSTSFDIDCEDYYEQPTTMSAVCLKDFTACVNSETYNPSKRNLCSLYREDLDCVRNLIKRNSDCSLLEKQVITSMRNTISRNMVLAKCSGAVSLVSSLLLCLGLTGVAYILTALRYNSGDNPIWT